MSSFPEKFCLSPETGFVRSCDPPPPSPFLLVCDVSAILLDSVWQGRATRLQLALTWSNFRFLVFNYVISLMCFSPLLLIQCFVQCHDRFFPLKKNCVLRILKLNCPKRNFDLKSVMKALRYT